MPKVIAERCPQDHSCPCVRVCRVGAITQKGYSAPEINMNVCTRCGLCTRVCPMGAIVSQK